LIYLLAFTHILTCQAGENDSLSVRRNVIRLNLSNPVLFGIKNNVVGYERLFKKNQSISVNIGRFSFPKFEPVFRDSFQLQKNYNDKGFHFSADYRWYLLKENKYEPPHGLFIGPYYAYNYLQRENYWDLNMSSNDQEIISNLSVNMNLIGLQLGCQFVIWKQLTLDVIFMGPGIWFFNVKSKTDVILSDEESEMLYHQMNEQLENTVPGYSIYLDSNEFEQKGSARTGKFGYRYLVNLGYRF
jgi:hypothetical protein